MDGSLQFHDGQVLYIDELLDENFDDTDSVIDAYKLDVVFHKASPVLNLE